MENKCIHNFVRCFVNFNISAIGGFLIKMLFLLLFESVFGWGVVWCNLAALLISGCFNYFMTDIWVFRKSKRDVESRVKIIMNDCNHVKSVAN